MQYCPVCFGHTLHIENKGVVYFKINGKSKDSSRFLYNLDHQDHEQFLEEFKTKLKEFFIWYSQFKNIAPIQYLMLYSSNFQCSVGCKFHLGHKFSIVDVLIEKKELLSIIRDLASQYKMEVQLDDNLG